MFHSSAFEYLTPSEDQLVKMANARHAMQTCSDDLDAVIPDGPDKTYLMRKLREVGFWANVAITRLPDGTPRL